MNNSNGTVELESIYLLVVIEHGIHVLDPDSVHGAVEEHPLKVRHLFPGTRTDQVRKNAVLQAHQGEQAGGIR